MNHDDEEKEKKHYRSKRWIGCNIEEEYFGDDRKATKKERKLATLGDRSKYKKTDRAKIEKSRSTSQQEIISRTDLKSGRVLAIAPEGVITVRGPDGDILCVLRGILKKEKQQLKNLVVINDNVLYETLGPNQGAIVLVEPRKTLLSRADNLSRRKEHLIAANIDQVIITGSVMSPPLKPALLDRYVIAARIGGLEPLIVINKIDLLEGNSDNPLQASEKELLLHLLEAYKEANLQVIPVSSTTCEGLDLLNAAMKDKSSVFSGQSGVGKSSLINAVTGSELKVGSVVDRTRKGSHTTSTARLLPLACGGWCVDTPGIKSFGIWDLKKEDIETYFSEIHRYGRECRFPDCSHFEEEDCAVRKAVEEGKISILRYSSYQSLLIGSSQEHKRR